MRLQDAESVPQPRSALDFDSPEENSPGNKEATFANSGTTQYRALVSYCSDVCACWYRTVLLF
jgi:hypothetical protein